MTTDDYANRLAEIASELAQRIRDEGPDDNARWLRTVLPDRDDRDNLLFVLAAAVPDDRPWRHLTAWTVAGARRPAPQPHGTPAAAKRHRSNGEKPCPPCEVAEREDWRLRKQEARDRKRTTTEPASTEETRAA